MTLKLRDYIDKLFDARDRELQVKVSAEGRGKIAWQRLRAINLENKEEFGRIR